MQRRFFSSISLLLMSLTATVLSACGGGSSNDGGGNASVRLVNVASGNASLDLYAADNQMNAAVLTNAVGSYSTLAEGTYTFNLKAAGSVAVSNSSTRSVFHDTSYSLVAYSSNDNLQTTLLSDNEAAPTSGKAKFRVVNLSTEAGNVDIFLTPPNTELAGLAPVVGGLAGARISTYVEVDKGTYQIHVTGTGDKTDGRLNIASITLADGDILSLILTSTPGGVLVNGNTLLQKGALTTSKNTSTRVRLVSGVSPDASVAAILNGKVLSSGLKSPAVGSPYILVNAGASVLPDVTVNGAAVATSSVTLVPGGDATLAVLGDANAPQVFLLNENNSPPVNSANANIRLVNGVQGLATGTKITLTIDFGVVASEVAFGSASVPAAVPAATGYRMEATGGANTLFLENDPKTPILAGRNYTLFMLGNATNPVGVFRRDR